MINPQHIAGAGISVAGSECCAALAPGEGPLRASELRGSRRCDEGASDAPFERGSLAIRLTPSASAWFDRKPRRRIE